MIFIYTLFTICLWFGYIYNGVGVVYFWGYLMYIPRFIITYKNNIQSCHHK